MINVLPVQGLSPRGSAPSPPGAVQRSSSVVCLHPAVDVGLSNDDRIYRLDSLSTVVDDDPSSLGNKSVASVVSSSHQFHTCPSARESASVMMIW